MYTYVKKNASHMRDCTRLWIKARKYRSLIMLNCTTQLIIAVSRADPCQVCYTLTLYNLFFTYTQFSFCSKCSFFSLLREWGFYFRTSSPRTTCGFTVPSNKHMNILASVFELVYDVDGIFQILREGIPRSTKLTAGKARIFLSFASSLFLQWRPKNLRQRFYLLQTLLYVVVVYTVIRESSTSIITFRQYV